MKKRSLKNLDLKKSVISKFEPGVLKGGINQTNPWICTMQCTVNPRYCAGNPTQTC